MKNRLIQFFSVLIAFMLFVPGCSRRENGENYQKFIAYEEFYGKMKLSTIDYVFTAQEERVAGEALLAASVAFSGKHASEAYKDINFGALKEHYLYSEDTPNVHVSHKIELITVKLKQKKGYIWLAYTVEKFDEDDNLVFSVKDKICYFDIEKIEDEWVVTNFEEPDF